MYSFLTRALGVVLALLLAAPGRAQQAPPTVVEGSAMQQAIAKVLFEAGSRAPAGATLPFRRDPAIRRQAEAQTVRQVSATNEAAGAQLSQLFASRDVLAAWGEAMQAYNLRLDNVADALTANWLVLYLSANQLADPPPAAQVAALGRQVRRVCALPGLADKLKTSAQRQLLADYLHLQSLLLNQAQTTAETTHDATASATLAERARQIAQHNMSFDPTTVVLTPRGLVRK